MSPELVQYGLPGIVIAGLCFFIMKMYNDRKVERREDREREQKNTDRMIDAFKENTNILSGLKTLLENRK